MKYTDDLNASVQKLALSISSMEAQMQKQLAKPLADFSAMYQTQMHEQAIRISQFAAQVSRQMSEAITPVIQQIIEKNMLDLEFVMPNHLAQVILELPQKVEKLLPSNEGESSLSESITFSNKVQVDNFTWRDIFLIVGTLISLLAFLNDLVDKDDRPEVKKVHQEVKSEVGQTINYIVNNYYINFPDDQPSSLED